jgi:DNA repair protein RadD
VNRATEFGCVNLIIIDEAHLVSPSDATMYQKFIAALTNINPFLRIIGLTATPWRTGHGHLTENHIFTDVCFDITGMAAFNRLLEEGYLTRLVPKKTQLLLDIEGVHKVGGEYVAKELQHAVDKQEITFNALKEALEYGHDRKSWLIFTTGVEHAIHTSEILNSMGIACEAVHGGNKQYPMSGKERDRILNDFKSGKLQAVTNNNVLTTGFDHPGIDMIVMLRPTASPGLWVQMLGRGTRPLYADSFDLDTAEGRLAAIDAGGKKNCLVLDFAGNTKRLGPINDPVIPKKKGSKPGDAPVKECPKCNTWIHASLKFCPECGNEFKIQTKLKITAGTDELIKSDLPVIEDFKIDRITYTTHEKPGKPTAMKVTYWCGRRKFNEYVAFQHDGFAGRKALQWWSERTTMDFPATTDNALALINEINCPTSVRVWINKKYPEIMLFCYDGSHFDKESPNNKAPEIETSISERTSLKRVLKTMSLHNNEIKIN